MLLIVLGSNSILNLESALLLKTTFLAIELPVFLIVNSLDLVLLWYTSPKPRLSGNWMLTGMSTEKDTAWLREIPSLSVMVIVPEYAPLDTDEGNVRVFSAPPFVIATFSVILLPWLTLP